MGAGQDHKDNAADDPAVIDLRNTVRAWKKGAMRRICVSNNQIKSPIAIPPDTVSESAALNMRK